MHSLKGSSLLETIVAAVIFLTVFAAVMEMLPRLSVRNDDALLVAQAQYRLSRTYEKYATGEWPCGEYMEPYTWGEIAVQIAPYRNFGDVQVVCATARIDGSRKQVVRIELVQWHQ